MPVGQEDNSAHQWIKSAPSDYSWLVLLNSLVCIVVVFILGETLSWLQTYHSSLNRQVKGVALPGPALTNVCGFYGMSTYNYENV